MAALNADLAIEQGTTFVLEFKLYNDQLEIVPLLTSAINNEGSVEYSMSNYRMRMKIKKSKYRTPVLYSAGTTMNFVVQPGSTEGFIRDGFLFVGGSTGSTRMVISSMTNESFKPGRYFYDVELVELVGSDEIVSRILEGKFEIDAEATKP
jgi:hypothetical protein